MRRFFTPPNQLTFLRILLTPVFIGMLFSENAETRNWSVMVFIIAGVTDAYDGWVARRWGFVTRFGKFFDPLADKIVTSAALIAFVILGLIPEWTVWAIVIRDVVITALRTYAELKDRPFDTTKLAKTKTFLQFIAIYYILILYVLQHSPLLPAEYGPLVNFLMEPVFRNGLMVLVAIITLVSGVLYMIDNRKTIQEMYGGSKQIVES